LVRTVCVGIVEEGEENKSMSYLEFKTQVRLEIVTANRANTKAAVEAAVDNLMHLFSAEMESEKRSNQSRSKHEKML
jgi:hypothetical protein